MGRGRNDFLSREPERRRFVGAVSCKHAQRAKRSTPIAKEAKMFWRKKESEPERKTIRPSNIRIHPTVDNGVKPGRIGLCGRHARLQMQGQARQGRRSRVADSPQSRLWLHEVLEACGISFLGGRGRATGQRKTFLGTATSCTSSMLRPPSSGTPARFAARTCTAASRTRRTRSTGLDFIHPELSQEAAPRRPEFAAFVSSVIEFTASVLPREMDGIRVAPQGTRARTL